MAGPTTLRISLNGQQLTSPLDYTYYAPQLSGLLPASGPAAGGTKLTVSGSSLRVPAAAPAARCVLNGTLMTNATWDEPSATLRCVTPAFSGAFHASDSVPFAVSLNGHELTTSAPMPTFYYIQLPDGYVFDVDDGYSSDGADPSSNASPLGFHSADKYSGTVDGGTLVTLTIDNVPALAASNPTCRLGSNTTAATYVSAGTLQCATPATAGSGSVGFETSLNGQDYSSSGTRFCYTDVVFSSVAPLTGPVAGNTRLLATGSGLVNHGCDALASAEPKSCRFSDGNRSVQTSATISTALDALLCYTPPLPDGWSSSAPLNLSVSLNARDFSSALPVALQQPPAQATLSPGCGPVAGGTAVTLFTAQLSGAPRIDAYFGAMPVPATRQSAGQLRCTTPDLHSVATSTVPAPLNPTPPELAFVSSMNSVSAAALAAAPAIGVSFDTSSAPGTLVQLSGSARVGPSAVGGFDETLLRISSPGADADGAATVVLPNGAPPMMTFDMTLELMFTSSGGASQAEAGGVSIVYGSGNAGSGLNVTLHATSSSLVPTVELDGVDIAAPTPTPLFDVGNPLDVFFGVEVRASAAGARVGAGEERGVPRASRLLSSCRHGRV